MEKKVSTIDAEFQRKTYPKGISDWGIIECYTSDFQNLPEGFPVGKARSVKISIRGYNLPMVKDCLIRYHGEWGYDKKYGWQFTCNGTTDIVKNDDLASIVALLSSKIFPGIGVTIATRIVEEFREKTWEVIENSPEKLLTVKGMRPDRVGAVCRAYDRFQSFTKLYDFLGPFGLKISEVRKISDYYGAEALDVVQSNPYQLVKISGITFPTVDKIGRALEIELTSRDRIIGATFEALYDVSAGGDMYCEWKTLTRNVMGLLNRNVSPENQVSYELFCDAIKVMKDKKMIALHYDIDNLGTKTLCVFSRAQNDAEYNSSQRLLYLLNNRIPEDVVEQCKNELKKFMEGADHVNYSEKQQAAIVKCVSNRVAILTGGPGTGKTTVVTGIIRIFKEVFKEEVILMAPTGKAARRMEESTHLSASTIHSRLELLGMDTMHKQDPAKIDHGYIIVDESSMIDNALLENLMKAIQNDKVHLLFVGDVDQLPSVGAGAVLSEMINSGVIPVAHLTEIFRQKNGGGTIITNAAKINHGEFDLEYDDSFQFVEATSDADAVEKIKQIYSAEVNQWGIDNVALLCPRRSRGKGERFTATSDGLNPILQEICNPFVSEAKQGRVGGKPYRIGDRVMQWKNTSTSANGDIGEILDIVHNDDGGAFRIKWDSGQIADESLDAMQNISLAYAMSIHKSQGSEYASVIIPIVSDQSCAMFKRNLLYTGVTRAKKKVIIVGDVKAINECIEHTDNNTRKTCLAKRLRYHSEKSNEEQNRAENA